MGMPIAYVRFFLKQLEKNLPQNLLSQLLTKRQHQYVDSIHTVFHTFPKVMTRRIFYNNEELLESVIISVILMPFISDSGVIL